MLEEQQIEILRRWVNQGAVIPDDESQVSHWAFQKPVRSTVPPFAPATVAGDDRALSSVFEANPIDAFITLRHQQHQLKALPAAPEHVQLRRVYVDLIGLPPTPEQLLSFLNDDSPNAWEKVVDKLLSSPQYGERWGRHWMDVWRYSDWDGHGAEVRESKPHIWRWRDWIIETLNEDKPYDRMIMEMPAAENRLLNDCQTLAETTTPAEIYQEPVAKTRNLIESRRVEIFIAQTLTDEQKWPLVKVVVKVERCRYLFETITKTWKNSAETAFYISTIVLSAQEFCQAIRQHWGVENSNHYVRDVTLGEDKSRIRTNPHIFAKLRSFALNILRKNKVENVSLELFDNSLNLDNVLNYVGIL